MFKKSKKRLGKKADVEIQINWIFILIVGGIILIFFIGLITKQKTVSTTKLNINIRESLDTIFTSSQVASGTANLINTPELEVDFDCDNYYVGEFDSGINKPLGQTRIIFVPDRLQGKQLVTWSLEWNMPYKIVDFLYIIPKEMRYIFVYDDNTKDFVEEIYNLLPKDVNKEIYEFDTFKDGTTLQYTNNYKTRIVAALSSRSRCSTTTGACPIHKSFEGKDISLLNIIPYYSSNSNHDSGEVVFSIYSKIGSSNHYGFDYANGNDPNNPFSYIDYNPEFVTEKRYPTLLGAIITDSIDIYKCMLRRAFVRNAHITSIYNARIQQIIDSAAQEGSLKQRGCIGGLYQVTDTDILAALPSYPTDLPLEILDAEIHTCKTNVQNCKANNVYPAVTALVSVNKKVQDNSCPLVY